MYEKGSTNNLSKQHTGINAINANYSKTGNVKNHSGINICEKLNLSEY